MQLACERNRRKRKRAENAREQNDLKKTGKLRLKTGQVNQGRRPLVWFFISTKQMICRACGKSECSTLSASKGGELKFCGILPLLLVRKHSVAARISATEARRGRHIQRLPKEKRWKIRSSLMSKRPTSKCLKKQRTWTMSPGQGFWTFSAGNLSG